MNRRLTPKRLKRWRTRMGWSQQELARRLNTTQPIVSMWESGLREPTYKQALAVLRAYALEIGEARHMLTRQLAKLSKLTA